ncbi:ATPase [Altererythrobacter sp. ZODW24]|uniref:ATPase n=1 Tax=Altererythrobacter sp. ZODW24 TaxID=2185142 RepID=UPI0013B3FA88|nr:ATPase [Altererythrobacter sp. ZODW24]
MTDRNRLVAIGPDHEPEEDLLELATEEGEELVLEDDWEEEWAEEEAAAPRSFTWVFPTLASLAVIGWTGFYGWVHWAAISTGGTPQLWSEWIVQWSVPVLLIVATWLLVMRNSRREASRFADSALALSLESERLEGRLTVINRELSLAREFLGAQSRELESLGRVASERISEHAGRLQDLVQSNGAQVDAIADVSTTALGNMDKLRDELPVIANSARDVSNQIGAAGQTASGQLEEMVSGFNRLNEFGQASGRQVDDLTVRIDAALANFEAQASQLDEIAKVRFGALAEKSEEFRTDLDNREVDALAAMRRRADALVEELSTARSTLEEQEEETIQSLRSRMGELRDGSSAIGNSLRESEKTGIATWQAQVESLRTRLTEVIEEVQEIDSAAIASANTRLQGLRDEATSIDEKLVERDQLFHQQVEERRADMVAQEEAAATAMMGQMDTLDGAIAQRRDDHAAHVAAMEEQGESLTARLSELEAQMSAIAAQGEDAQRSIAGGSDNLAARLADSREALETTGNEISELTEASVRLLELIQAAAQHSGEELPASVGMAEERLSTLASQAENVRSIVAEADEKGRGLSDYVIKAEAHGREAANELESLQERLKASDGDHALRIDEMRSGLAALHDDSVRVAERSQGELRDAIAALEAAAGGAVAALGQGSADQVRALADSVGDQAAQSIDRALRERTSNSIAELDQAAAKAANVGRDATVQLRDQLALVNELTGNLETRVSHARERAQEQIDNDFARRVALITESLNSNAIDIAKSLSTDVTDTSWAAYLRGDRGIFTRRAVRLLDNQEARDIAGLYDEDPDFNDHVSRYIHDFEAMLRSLLSTRDGNALGVTLLSSDMGKLYVALAQSIERLRD